MIGAKRARQARQRNRAGLWKRHHLGSEAVRLVQYLRLLGFAGDFLAEIRRGVHGARRQGRQVSAFESLVAPLDHYDHDDDQGEAAVFEPRIVERNVLVNSAGTDIHHAVTRQTSEA